MFTLVSDGVLEITLIRYPEPVAAATGIVAVMLPDVVLVKLPIAVGDAKEPDASDNCAVNTLPDVQVPVIVYGTVIEAP